MSTTYKVWIEIEEYDEDTGDSVNLDGPGASVREFDSLERAETFVEDLTSYALQSAPVKEHKR